MKPVSRRSVMAGAAAAVAGVTAVGLSKSVEAAPDLARLIAEHRASFAAFTAAIDRNQAIDEAWEKLPDTVVVPCLLGGGYSLKYGRKFCEEHLCAEYYHAKERLKKFSRVSPDLARQMSKALDKAKKENYAILDRMLAAEDARKEAGGLAQAERDTSNASDAEYDAFAALCAYRCRTADELKAKAKYLLTTANVNDTWDADATALLKSLV